LAKRAGLLDEQTTACRLINGESDGWPGLVLDRYGGVLVLKLYTVAWLSRVPMLVELLREVAQPESVVLRLSRNVQEGFAKAGFKDGQVVHGPAISGPVIFLETGLSFEANVVHGQKTGFFLDQRENRREVETRAHHGDVLNAFSFTGGFSLYAARGGARSVASLDISAHALAGAERNFALNQSHVIVARCPHTTIQANAFEWLEGNAERMFDLIVLDPPSLAKREAEREGAIRAYETLAFNALRHLRTPGVLVAASCSAHVSAAEFFAAVERGVKKSRRKCSAIKSTGHAPDHAASFAEAEYLKCVFLRCD
jgi:23S rRNA (cytosine1962-C5)-methyltransferase